MHRGQFKLKGSKITLDIDDTSGQYPLDFPSMFDVSLSAADAVLLVFSDDVEKSFEMVTFLHDRIARSKNNKVPLAPGCRKKVP